jgi:hypothetical protein
VRAETGGCPVGLTCSTETPNGLFFVGAAFSDGIVGASDVAPIAAGGVEKIEAVTGTNANSPPFGGSFTATSSDPSVLVVDFVTPPSLQARGVATGTSYARLFQPGTSMLLDEVDVKVEPIAKATLVPLELALVLDQAKGTPPAPWALLAGAADPIPLVAQLHAANGDRLVDEEMQIASTAASVTQPAWDLAAATLPAQPGTADFTIQAGGASFAVTAPLVASVDDIESWAGMATMPPTVTTTSDVSLCFTARSGGVPVAGATWQYNASAGLTVQMTASATVFGNCVEVQGTAVGPATVTVTASGFTKSFAVTVKARRAVHVMRQERLAVPGHRATIQLF